MPVLPAYKRPHIFWLAQFQHFIFSELLVLHKAYAYLENQHVQIKGVGSPHKTLNILNGTNLRTCTLILSFLTSIFEFYGKNYAISKKRSSKSVEKRPFYDKMKLTLFKQYLPALTTMQVVILLFIYSNIKYFHVLVEFSTRKQISQKVEQKLFNLSFLHTNSTWSYIWYITNIIHEKTWLMKSVWSRFSTKS